MQGRPLSLLHSPRNNQDFADVWEEVTLDGSWQGNVWHRHASGSDYLARVSIASVRNDEGTTTHYVVEYSDATDAWESEQALRARTDELARSNRELEQFAYVASHDLQEPLRMVASYTQLLARRYKDKLDDDANEFISFAVDGATRMQVLINDLLKLSRVGTRGKAFAAIEADKLVDAAIANLDIAIREANAQVVREPLPKVFGDDTQLIQLFQNLIGNAIKFKKPDAVPTIRVGAVRIGRAWQFSVSDNGIGIGPEYFERIFVIFQRLHAKSEYPGTGIGLALCKKIVERHGGRIWVESQPGEGTTFHFTVPDREE
jgi:light-regulated signal transduction histidine kinase (bacteriophytochrome)